MANINIHHATEKKAAAHNLQFVEIGSLQEPKVAVITRQGQKLADGTDPKEVLERAIVSLSMGEQVKSAKARSKPSKDDIEDGEDEEVVEDDDEAAAIDEMEAQQEAEEEEEAEGRSVVKKKYKKRYRPHSNRCGDDLSLQISEHVAERDEKGNLQKPLRVDAARLKKFAKANGVWKTSYGNLNVGMQRMNISTRLRALLKKGDTEIIWD